MEQMFEPLVVLIPLPYWTVIYSRLQLASIAALPQLVLMAIGGEVKHEEASFPGSRTATGFKIGLAL